MRYLLSLLICSFASSLSLSSLELRDTQVDEAEIRALLGTATHFPVRIFRAKGECLLVSGFPGFWVSGFQVSESCS